jgi:hypothetical protein
MPALTAKHTKGRPNDPRLNAALLGGVMGPLLAPAGAEKGKGWRTFFGSLAGMKAGEGLSMPLLALLAKKGKGSHVAGVKLLAGLGGAGGGAAFAHGPNSKKQQAKIDAWDKARKRAKLKTAAAKKEKKKPTSVAGGVAAVAGSLGLNTWGGLKTVVDGVKQEGLSADKIEKADPAFQKAYNKMRKKFERGGGKVSDSHVLQASFRPDQRLIMHPEKNIPVGLHELGHSTASAHGRKGALSKAMGAARRASMNTLYGFGRTTAIPAGILASLGGKSEDADKAGKRGALIGGALSTPMVAEEATANVQAMKNINRAAGGGKAGRAAMLKYMKKIGPAFSSYVGLGGLAMAAPYLSGKIRKRAHENAELKKLLKRKRRS